MSRRTCRGLIAGLGVAALTLLPSASASASHSTSLPRKEQSSKTCSHPLAPVALVGSNELITVVGASLGAATGELRLYQRKGGCFEETGGPFPAELGVGGLSVDHHEGDGTTPAGLFGFAPVMYGALADPGLAYSYRRLVCGDWWDEDARSPAYNQFVQLPCGATPSFGGGSEALWRTLPAYDYFAVINYNAAPVVKGRGSAIFLHVSTGAPTIGCVSLPAAALLLVLRSLSPAMHPLIAIGTAATLATLRARQNL